MRLSEHFYFKKIVIIDSGYSSLNVDNENVKINFRIEFKKLFPFQQNPSHLASMEKCY